MIFCVLNTELKSLLTSTPRSSFGRSISSAFNEPKFQKVDILNFDDLSVWKAMNSFTQTKMEKFDYLKDNARILIGKLECSIVTVGGSTETHGVGVLAFRLEKESAEWYLNFNADNEETTWKMCKDAFIKEFENSFAKNLSAIMEKKKAT